MKKVIAILMILVFSAIIIIYNSDKMIPWFVFRPEYLPTSYKYKLENPYEEYFINSGNRKINVVRCLVNQPKGAILYFHGNKDNLERWSKIAELLTGYGYDVFVMDYSGYGKSTGTPSEENLTQDAESLCHFVNDSFCYQHKIYFGRSLGSGVAAWLSSIHAPEGLILETPYYSLDELIEQYFPFYQFFDEKPIRFNTYEYLKNASMKILILHGTDDDVTPYFGALRLYDSIQRPNVTMITLQDGTHGNLSTFDEYWDALGGFLEE
ncbi:MAG: alpha/beta hydrolase [Saprospiraceae bacterium]|nr:alpha/beta hydrolase [Saprospiraceae bacterium]